MGASKSGDTLNLIIAVSVSDREILKRAASAPEEIVTVADSDTLIVTAVPDVAMFYAAENEDDVKVGAVVSGEYRITKIPDPPGFPPPPPPPVFAVPGFPELARVV